MSVDPAGVVNADFRTPIGWRDGHLQSIRNRVVPDRWKPDVLAPPERLLVDTGDGTGDQLSVLLHRAPPAADGDVDGAIAFGTGLPTVLLVHGLGGSADSTYIRAAAVGLLRSGFDVARVDLRSAGESTRTTRHMYHAGKSEDLRAVLRNLARRQAVTAGGQPRQQPRPEPTLALMGFSLGGAVTLKLLGEPTEGLPIVAGVAVSAPIDLVAGSPHLTATLHGVYERAILRTLRRDALTPAPDGTDRVSPAERAGIQRARRLPDFDDVLTAPRNGWQDADEYYRRNSAAPFLPRIRVPTLMIHAQDDPMIPFGPYEAVDWAALQRLGYVQRAITPHGGHVGFHQRGRAAPWYVPMAVRFLAQASGQDESRRC